MTREQMPSILLCTGHSLKIPDIVESRDVYVWDKQGKQYMDLESGVWCTSIGHHHEKINRVIREQTASLMHAGFCYSHPVVEEAGQSILSITPFEKGQCVFLCSGSEAIEISRQVAKHVTGHRRSMTLHDSYLGSYSSTTDRSKDWFVFDWEPCQSCDAQEQCDPYCKHLKAIPGDIADFVFEPGSSSGFVRFPPKTLIRNLVDNVRQNGGTVIANEVTTGIGRTGKWFGFEHYDIKPDMIAIGKGIGNGYPVSVAVFNERIASALRSRPFKYAQSHQNDPLGAGIVKTTIEVIRENDLISQSEKNGYLFLEQLASLVDAETILAVRGRGLMFALDMADANVASLVFDKLIERGFIVGNRGVALRIDPPLTIDPSDFKQFVDCLQQVISELG